MKRENIESELRQRLTAGEGDRDDAVWSTSVIADAAGCSYPTARAVLLDLASDAWLREIGNGRWFVRSAEERDRVLSKRASYSQAKACAADLNAHGVKAETGPRSGNVSVPAVFLRALVGHVGWPAIIAAGLTSQKPDEVAS